jgi:hypothetical protein
VVFDAELRPAERLTVELDGVLNVPDSEVERVSARIREDVDTLLTWSLEYNYRREDSSLLAYEATLLPRGRWTFSLYTRYEFEARHLEEIGGFVQRNLDCLAIRAGVNVMPGYTRADGGEQEDDLRFVFGIWLTAFPEVGLSDRYLN